ncbi:MAG: AMP-binding protein [Polyangiaceae bacterium]
MPHDRHDPLRLLLPPTSEAEALRLRIGPPERHRRIRYTELRRLVLRAARAFETSGLEPGARVGLLLPQGERVVAWFLGAIHRGLVPCILASPTAKMDPEKYDRNLAAVLESLALAALVSDDRHVGGDTRRLDGKLPVEEASPAPRPRGEGPLFLQFTGGTTGTQKHVAVTPRMLRAQLESYTAAIDLRPDDAVISWLPLYHDMGLVAALLLPLLHGLPVTLLDPMQWVLDPGSLLVAASEDRASLCWLPNFAFAFLATKARVPADLDLRDLRAVVSCSEPVRPASIDAFLRRFTPHGLAPSAIHASYAMAEATFAVSQTTAADPLRRLLVSSATLARGLLRADPKGDRWLASSGPLVAGVELRVLDAASEGEVGEIAIRGPAVMGEGWHHTGDLGAVVDGHVYVTGRKRDLIIVGGVNVFAEDVEHASQVPGVHPGRAVALGLDDEAAGTERLVVVAEAEQPLDAEQRAAIEWAIRAAVLAACGVAPHRVHVVPPRFIVKSTAGKIARGDTRRRLLERGLA